MQGESAESLYSCAARAVIAAASIAEGRSRLYLRQGTEGTVKMHGSDRIVGENVWSAAELQEV